MKKLGGEYFWTVKGRTAEFTRLKVFPTDSCAEYEPVAWPVVSHHAVAPERVATTVSPE